MRLIFRIFLVLFSATSINAMKVAIIGAGASGIAAAQKIGESPYYTVKVFEKNDRIGGKCLSIPCSTGKGVIDLGAIQIGVSYPHVHYYAHQLNLKTRKFWESRVLLKDHSEDDNEPIYETIHEHYWPSHDNMAIAQEVVIMAKALKRFAAITNFQDIPDDSEFLQNFEDFADNLKLNHFKEEFRIWITSYGYGSLKEIPTYLALSLINASASLVLMRKLHLDLRMFALGYQNLLVKMVEHYNIDVQLNSYITHIVRSADKITIFYQINYGQVIKEDFDYLVIASGLESLPMLLNYNLTKAEEDLINDLTFLPYDVVIADIPKLEKGGYVLPENLSQRGHVTLISKNCPQADDVILYVPRIMGSSNNIYLRPDEDDLKNVVIKDMRQYGLEVDNIFHIKYWDNYFPHFKHKTSYGLLKQIQGQNRTIIVGPPACFEIVEQAMKHAINTVSECLPHIAVDNHHCSLLNSLWDYITALPKEQL